MFISFDYSNSALIYEELEIFLAVYCETRSPLEDIETVLLERNSLSYIDIWAGSIQTTLLMSRWTLIKDVSGNGKDSQYVYWKRGCFDISYTTIAKSLEMFSLFILTIISKFHANSTKLNSTLNYGR